LKCNAIWQIAIQNSKENFLNQYKLVMLLFMNIFIATVCHAESHVVHGFSMPAKTATPFTYCIWYLSDPENESFLKELKVSPADLFHLGYQIPFKGAYGPAYGGELYSDDFLAPNELQREIERIQRVIHKMRTAGVTRLIPYVYTMAFFGRPDERTGFFKFYDRWDEYREFGLGPKPAADPSLWSQVRGPEQLGGGPSGVLHYDPCINHPAWAEYLDLVVRQAAACGYDGMFFDVNTLYCYCPHCQEKFDIYLLEKYGKKGLREFFGTDDHRMLNLSTIYRDFEDVILSSFKPYLAQIWDKENVSHILGVTDTSEVKLENDWRLLRCYMQNSLAEYPPQHNFQHYLIDQFGGETVQDIAGEKKKSFVQTFLRYHFHQFLESRELAALLQQRFQTTDIRHRCCSTPRDLLLWVETQRFWCQSMASQFARLKRVGRIHYAEQGRGDDFYTVANLGSMITLDALNKRRVDAIDLVHWAPMTDLQMFEEVNQVGSLESGVIFSNIFAFRWAMAAGTHAGTLLYQVTDDVAADLAYAEVAAGGGGAFIQAGLAAPESRQRWKQFFADHADLWDDGNSWVEVGLLFWSDQVFYENTAHLASVRALVHVLSEHQIPFDIITEENINSIMPYQVVIAPQLYYLDESQIELLLNYTKTGGNLVIVEPFGVADKFARLRQSDPLKNICLTAGDFKTVSYGQGKMIRLKSEAIPQRQSDLWVLMEERANDFILARDFLNQARQADLNNGVDLGANFIQRLEQALALSLRWCPASTDPGIYLHAYRLPAKQSRPERIVIHAVNYRLPIVVEQGHEANSTEPLKTKAGQPVVFHNLHIKLPLPLHTKIQRVQTLSATDQPSSVKWHTEKDQVDLTLSQITIYQALIIELENKAK
jgi:hypothetical protein